MVHKRQNRYGPLSGFTTVNSAVIGTIKEDLAVLQASVIDAYWEERRLIRYPEGLIDGRLG